MKPLDHDALTALRFLLRDHGLTQVIHSVADLCEEKGLEGGRLATAWKNAGIYLEATTIQLRGL